MKKSSPKFSTKTFDYFEAAKKNKKNKAWFEKHRLEFEEHVKMPFEVLTESLQKEFGKDLPRIDFTPRKITRPVRRNPDDEGGILRTNASAFFAEKATSQFEWNPGIYISVGAKPGDNILGLGLYMVLYCSPITR